MIDHENQIIYIDHSALAAFRSCKERGHLAYFRGLRQNKTALNLDYGTAVHAGLSTYHDAIAGGYHDAEGWHKFETAVDPIAQAKAAFVKALENQDEIGISVESEDRRSVERGIAILDAYFDRWKAEPYRNVCLENTGEPLNEIGFQFTICTYRDYEIRLCGVIDRVVQSVDTGRLCNIETKTTTTALQNFVKQCRPNHQVTTYAEALTRMFPDLFDPTDTVHTEWDCIFISDRMPDYKRALVDRHMMFGVDKLKDFTRQPTSRTLEDRKAWLADTIYDSQVFANFMLLDRDEPKPEEPWPMNTNACHIPACVFREACSLNDKETYLRNFFIHRPWEPWKRGHHIEGKVAK